LRGLQGVAEKISVTVQVFVLMQPVGIASRPGHKKYGYLRFCARVENFRKILSEFPRKFSIKIIFAGMKISTCNNHANLLLY